MKNTNSNRALLIPAIVLAAAAGVSGQDTGALDTLLNRIVARERSFVEQLRSQTPLIETYLQEAPGIIATTREQDHYFLGRLNFTDVKRYTPIAARSDSPKGSHRLRLLMNRPIAFAPVGFAQMIFIDAENFSRKDYSFEYVRREFSGGLRCIVFDVAPLDLKAVGRFIGRIWVEERDVQIVRFNGTFSRSSNTKIYFHFDSWRSSTAAGGWVPALVYVEEFAGEEKHGAGLTFKGQTRLWGYTTGKSARIGELTSLAVELEKTTMIQTPVDDNSPLENQRSWEHQAEENILDRLEKGGFLAAKGPVDQVLETVVNNLLTTNELNLEVHCRIILTTPLESFTVGRTIVVSRGLLDVLPDEASLAMVLADELAHIALGHRTNTQFAFHDQTMFSDEDLLERFRFSRTPDEIDAAGVKAVDILSKSPYQGKLSNAGLFLKALSSLAPRFPNLIRANIGNRLADGGTIPRMAQLISMAPALEDKSLEQIAALPLGSRIKLDAWTGSISLVKTKAISLLSAREKLLFEITPFAPQFSRSEASSGQPGSND